MYNDVKTYSFSNSFSLLCTCVALFALYLNLSMNTWNQNKQLNYVMLFKDVSDSFNEQNKQNFV